MSARSAAAMQITESNHLDDTTYTLGVCQSRSVLRRDFDFHSVPGVVPPPDSDMDWLLEKLDGNGLILEDKFISRETAGMLLGQPVESARLAAVAELQRWGD